jgi:uncharacterized protein
VGERFTFDVAGKGETSALVYYADARAKEPIEATLLLAHGAGAPQTHPFMVAMARRLAERGMDVVTFDFLYTANGRKFPDRNDVLESCWRAAIASVRARVGLRTARLFIGGKSMGGRIASQVAAAGDGLTLSGLVLLGYPLHPPKKPKTRRDAHLGRVPFPMLFVQGSRDAFGDEAEMTTLARSLPDARLFVVPGGDHSFAISKREGAERQEQVLAAAADAIARFVSDR